MKITKLLWVMLFSITVAACGGGGGSGGGSTGAAAITATATTTAQSLTVGTAMTSFSPLTPSGGATPYTYSYTGTLPTGLNFSTSTGAVTGTPTATYATASLIFSVKDANNVVASTTSTVSFNASGFSPQATGWPHAVANTATSYKNFKEIGLTPQNLPTFGDARGYGNFTGGGPFDIFISSLNYLGQPTPAAAANFPATFSIYSNNPQGNFVSSTISIHGDTPCIHSRKALVADFNGDGKPDIFVACHGFDYPPYPGEKNKLLLSQPDGSYLLSTPSNEVGYFHSATAADVNGDGLPDVLVVNWQDTKYPFHWLINQGGGTFVSSYDGLPPGLSGMGVFTVELVDIDGDGIPDLFLSGFVSQGTTPVVYINPGNFDFSKATPIPLPSTGKDFVTDVVAGLGTGGRTLWLSKTDNAFSSASMQTIQWPSLSSTENIVVNQGWIRWIVPVTSTNMIETDNISEDPLLPM